MCWFSILSVKNRGKLNSIVYKGNTFIGVRQTGVSQLYETRAKKGVYKS